MNTKIYLLLLFIGSLIILNGITNASNFTEIGNFTDGYSLSLANDSITTPTFSHNVTTDNVDNETTITVNVTKSSGSNTTFPFDDNVTTPDSGNSSLANYSTMGPQEQNGSTPLDHVTLSTFLNSTNIMLLRDSLMYENKSEVKATFNRSESPGFEVSSSVNENITLNSTLIMKAKTNNSSLEEAGDTTNKNTTNTTDSPEILTNTSTSPATNNSSKTPTLFNDTVTGMEIEMETLTFAKMYIDLIIILIGIFIVILLAISYYIYLRLKKMNSTRNTEMDVGSESISLQEMA